MSKKKKNDAFTVVTQSQTTDYAPEQAVPVVAKSTKYQHVICGTYPSLHMYKPCLTVDVYDVLCAFSVDCPARAHAIKKVLCAGKRDKGDATQDLKEAIQALYRAIELID
jgi:hypothetical protein